MAEQPDNTVGGAVSDEALLGRFVRGDDTALGELARRHEGHLLGLARGLMGGSAGLAEEAVQEAWVRVIRFAPGFRGESSFKTWVYRIVINRCRELGRRRGRGASMSASARAADAQDGAGVAEAAELNGTLHAAVSRLPVREREAVLVCYHSGLTQREAARVLGIAEGTVKSRSRSALRRLRREIGAALGEEL